MMEMCKLFNKNDRGQHNLTYFRQVYKGNKRKQKWQKKKENNDVSKLLTRDLDLLLKFDET